MFITLYHPADILFATAWPRTPRPRLHSDAKSTQTTRLITAALWVRPPPSISSDAAGLEILQRVELDTDTAAPGVIA